MRKFLSLAAFLLLVCIASFAQNPPGGYGPGTSSGSSSPSSLTVFFNGFYGLSPKDTGAAGNGKMDSNCTANGTTTYTCSDNPFTAADTGKVFETSNGTTPTPTVTTGTLTFVSAGQVTTSVTVAAGQTIMRWATDDTAGLRSWASGIIAAGSVHGGYIPKGTFYTTKAMRFIAPLVTANDCNSYLTSGGGSITNCGVWIQGAGYTNSNIWVATAGSFNWAADGSGAGLNTAPMYFNGWSGGNLSGFSIDFDGTAHTTSGQTGLVAGIMFDNVAHFYVNNVWVQGAHNTTNGLVGWMTTGNGITAAGPGAFESQFNPIIAEINDINLYACDMGTGTCEKETYANSFFEQSINANVIVGNANTLKQIRFDNVHIINSANGSASSQLFNISGATSVFDSVVIANSRFQASTAGAPFLGVIRLTNTGTTTGLDISNTYFETTGAGSYPIILAQSGAHANVRISGGALSSGNACASACIIANNDANSFFYIGSTGIFPLNSTDAFMFGGTSVANIATFHDTTSPLGVGFGTRGSVTASQYGTFTKCAANGTAASPSIVSCAAASSGVFSCGVGAETVCTVNTTAMTNAGSSVIVTQDSSTTTGTLLGVTCNVTVNAPEVTAKVAATSFSITIVTPAVNPACFQYHIMN